MSEEKKTVELKEEELQKVVGGKGDKPPLGVYKCPNCNQICMFSPESFRILFNVKCPHCNVTTNIGNYEYLGTEEDYFKSRDFRY